MPHPRGIRVSPWHPSAPRYLGGDAAQDLGPLSPPHPSTCVSPWVGMATADPGPLGHGGHGVPCALVASLWRRGGAAEAPAPRWRLPLEGLWGEGWGWGREGKCPRSRNGVGMRKGDGRHLSGTHPNASRAMGKLRHSWGGSSCASRVGTVTRNPKILEVGSCRSNPFLKIPSLGDPTAARSGHVLSLSRCLVQLKAAGDFRERQQLQPSASGRDPTPGLPKTHRPSPAASRQRCLRSRPVGFNQLGSPLSYFGFLSREKFPSPATEIQPRPRSRAGEFRG